MCDRKHFDILRARVPKALADARQAGLVSARESHHPIRDFLLSFNGIYIASNTP